MNEYTREINLDEAYRLINTGPALLISTVSEKGEYNIAPIAWGMPARKTPTRVVLGVGKSHKTYTNIIEKKVFTVGIPNIKQAELIKNTGKTTGKEINKFDEFNIEAIPGATVDVKIPAGMIGFIECKTYEVFDVERLALIVGDACYAAADPGAFNGERLLTERAEGKAVHHLGNKVFTTTGDVIIT